MITKSFITVIQTTIKRTNQGAKYELSNPRQQIYKGRQGN